jgi:hypothetical protein
VNKKIKTHLYPNFTPLSTLNAQRFMLYVNPCNPL